MANIQVKVDDNLKRAAHAVASDLGLDVATAVRMFLTQMVRVKGLPFQPIADPFYSDANMERLRKAIADVKSGKAKLTEHELIEVEDD
jgi:DNA-damage-inducible protein J